MFHQTPRHSALFALRDDFHHGSVDVQTSHSPFMVPAYSQDSEVLGCGDHDGIFCRRTPDDGDGKEMATIRIVQGGHLHGGAAWYPDGNRFYHGGSQVSATDGGLIYVVEPDTDIPRRIYVTGEDGKYTDRAFWHPALNQIWLAYWSGGGKSFLKLDPSDDSVIGYVSGAAPLDFDYCASNSNIYFVAGAVYKCTSAGSISALFTQADFEVINGGPVFSRFEIGPIAYVDTLGAVVFPILWNDASTTWSNFWKIDVGSEVASPITTAATVSFLLAAYLHYSPQFDRLIIQFVELTFGLPIGPLAAYDPSNLDAQTAILGTDFMTAPKGVYCDNVDKIALPVLTGPGGGRFHSVNFYSAADLG